MRARKPYKRWERLRAGLVMSAVWIAGFALVLAVDGKLTGNRWLRGGFAGVLLILAVFGFAEWSSWKRERGNAPSAFAVLLFAVFFLGLLLILQQYLLAPRR